MQPVRYLLLNFISFSHFRREVGHVTSIFGYNSDKINIRVNEDFWYMKIHIFALRWKDEIRRSSLLEKKESKKKSLAIEQWSNYSVRPPLKLWRKTSKLTWSIHRTKSFFMVAPITLSIKLLQHAESIVDKSKIHPTPTPLYLSYNEWIQWSSERCE